MSRTIVRAHKRAIQRGSVQQAADEQQRLGRESAVSLLMRSIAFQHRRLAVVRLGTAAQLGAAVPVEAWNYCRNLAAVGDDDRLRSLFLDAARCATTAPPGPPE